VAIKHALLGLLAEGPKHGCELKTAFDETIGERWSLNIGQVYNTLNRLVRDGYVVLQEEMEQESRPDKKVYAITNAGREELFRWLAEPVEKPRRLKDEFYIGYEWGYVFPSKAIVTGLVAALLAALYPDWRAARLDVVEAIRHE